MAVSGINLIKKRIKSIKNTKKITNAMGMVASAKMKKTEKYLKINNVYNEQMNNIMGDIFYAALEEKSENIHKYVSHRKSNKNLYIILTSDVGLCGGYNSAVLSFAIEKLKKDNDFPYVITLGEKGRLFFNKVQYETTAEYVDMADIPTDEEAEIITSKCREMYDAGKIKSIYIIYYKFISVVKKEIVFEKLLPIDTLEDFSKITYKSYEYDLKDEHTLDFIVNMYFKQKILNSMISAKASEQSFRMEAMEAASKNAKDLLSELQKKYNRIRQNTITKEIAEIVGGAEAQK